MSKQMTDRALIGLVVVLVVIGVALMVIGFGGAGGGGVDATPTKGKLSDYLTQHPIVTIAP